MTASRILTRTRLCMDRAHTLEGLHRLALLKYKLISILHGGTT